MEFTQLLLKLQKDYPNLNIELGSSFSWNSKHNRITYFPPQKEDHVNKYSNKLLHEVAHSILEHTDYKSDVELLKIESSTWELTKRLAKSYNISFNTQEQHDSLASYIAWSSSRSQCAKCKKNGLQTLQTEFLCPNCSHKWKVSKSRFTRTYRKT